MQPGFRLDGKIALVTGAAGGLGAHFARCLFNAGAAVALSGRREAPLRALANELTDQGGRAAAIPMDVTDATSVAAAFDAIEEQLGVADIIVCNAGVVVDDRSIDLSEADWDRVVDTNLKGPWLVSNEAARRLIDAAMPGSVINVTSILGHRVASRVIAYTSSKAGLEQMTHALALEWARYGIRVNALAPGYIETDLNRDFFATDAGQTLIKRIPQRRLGQAADLDGPLLLLASDHSAYMTGSTIVVDGGHLQSSL